MIQYFANIMTSGYKTTKIQIQAKSDSEAREMTRSIAHEIPGCIGYSTLVKVPGKRIHVVNEE